MAEARGTTESVEEIQADASAIMTTDHMHALKYNYTYAHIIRLPIIMLAESPHRYFDL